ncbi:uncharacterized protein LOC127079747 [Lathyrus oleraceus]|uniref:uncharacterized protein LOC127079747 n=1 Tax=Pisum sativum TaxID=3888 RepID=UPI001FC5C8B9|nr:uncharacterized protein LOC127079747 [Pisum sativum]
MAKSPYLDEDCVKSYKLKTHSSNHDKAKNLSFFASIFSLFIYISIFYIFNLSPSTLLNNNIFWFIMSNTLILIIAIDYEAFSSSKQKQEHLHEEYVKHSHEIRNHVSSIATYDEVEQVDKQCIINPKQELEHVKKDTIVPERVLEIVLQNQPKKSTNDDRTNEKKNSTLHLQVEDDSGHKEHEEKAKFPTRSIFRRSKSYRHNRAKHVVVDERKKSVRRLDCMKIEPKVEEENEFSMMSNEDLNKRVEEFIQKFNKQIRLQASSIN